MRYYTRVSPVFPRPAAPCRAADATLIHSPSFLRDRLSRFVFSVPRAAGRMSRRILFAIRSKLGDSLAAYASVRQFADAHPQDAVTLLIRRDYGDLLRDEAKLRVIGFGSRVEMVLKLLWLRVAESGFDVFAVLWGFGNPVVTMARLVSARRKIFVDDRFREWFPEFAQGGRYQTLAEPAAQVIRVFEPEFATPVALIVSSLAARHAASVDRRAIAIVPLADEPRRNLDRAALEQLIHTIAARHPGAPLRVFVNPAMTDAAWLLHAEGPALPDGAAIRQFRNLGDLVREYLGVSAWYGTDTGLYHLAVAMGIPATVFFGPTQPLKICMPRQPDVAWVRLAMLGNDHCDETGCRHPLCLHQAIANFCDSNPASSLDMTPQACPLRAYPSGELVRNSVHENPGH